MWLRLAAPPRLIVATSFHQSFIHYPSYEVDVEFRHALDAFGQSGVNGILNVDFTLVRTLIHRPSSKLSLIPCVCVCVCPCPPHQHRINRSFTTFEISVKYTLVFISLVCVATAPCFATTQLRCLTPRSDSVHHHSCLLGSSLSRCAACLALPGPLNSAGLLLSWCSSFSSTTLSLLWISSSTRHAYCTCSAAHCAGLLWLLFMVVVDGSPSLVWTGISTVLAVSFMAAMLMFWLCVVDVVRSASAPVCLPPPSNTLCSLGNRVGLSTQPPHTRARIPTGRTIFPRCLVLLAQGTA